MRLRPPLDASYPVGLPIRPLTLPLATGLVGAATYTLTVAGGAALDDALPGLVFDPTQGVLSGTPLTGTEPVTLIYAVTDTIGTVSVAFEISVTGLRAGHTGGYTYWA